MSITDYESHADDGNSDDEGSSDGADSEDTIDLRFAALVTFCSDNIQRIVREVGCQNKRLSEKCEFQATRYRRIRCESGMRKSVVGPYP